jgi:hypothetical protein
MYAHHCLVSGRVVVHSPVTAGGGVPCGCSPSQSCPHPHGLCGAYTHRLPLPLFWPLPRVSLACGTVRSPAMPNVRSHASDSPGPRVSLYAPRCARRFALVAARASLPCRPLGTPSVLRRAVPWCHRGTPGVLCASMHQSDLQAGVSCLGRLPGWCVAVPRGTPSLQGAGQGGVASQSVRWTGLVLDTRPPPTYDSRGGMVPCGWCSWRAAGWGHVWWG